MIYKSKIIIICAGLMFVNLNSESSRNVSIGVVSFLSF